MQLRLTDTSFLFLHPPTLDVKMLSKTDLMISSHCNDKNTQSSQYESSKMHETSQNIQRKKVNIFHCDGVKKISNKRLSNRARAVKQMHPAEKDRDQR